MNIKKNDKVKILSGKDKGKIGKVLQVLPKEAKVSIEGLNLLIKHLRPQKQGEKGQRIEFPAFINESNVALVCSKCGQTTRVGYKIIKGEGKKDKKFRACKKCQEIIE
ncbi:MAG TPA: 50S ribosomal protein L24 [Candidatus Saccharimonadales bacterium]|nr:50S ribosomal protein L24 [Candidatus Saccharimonadales bacterium]